MATNAKNNPIFDDTNNFSRKYHKPINVTNTSLIKSHMILTDVSVSEEREKYTMIGCNANNKIGMSKYSLE
jgi:DNA/RNA-binding domain of Phe-tRNA-synthetase-like protein